jgi:hypothetical protein
MWSVSVGKKTILVNALCLTHGSYPKALDISVPTIPLEVALDPARLSRYIEPHHKVVVFGTQHSGAVVIKNLLDCSAQEIIAVYKESSSKAPFRWARDGDYDGLKRDSAIFADDVMKGVYPSVQCVPSTNITEVVRGARKADWVIYAIGFERNPVRIQVDGVLQEIQYEGTSGKLSCPYAWGFGIAYPSQAPDGIHWDVGISSFLEHMSQQIDSILATIDRVER